MHYSECLIENQTSQPILSVRMHIAVTDLHPTIGMVYGRIGRYLASIGEEPAGVPFVA
jgi:hypothetical protein